MQRRTTAGRLMLNSLCGVSVNVVTALVSIFLTPYILRQMGDQRYGVWAVLGSVYAYSMVLQFGLYSAINRHIPMHLAHHDDAKIREVTSTTSAFFLLLGLLIVTLIFAFAGPILSCFTIPANLIGAARIGLYTVGIVAALSLTLNASSAILSGYQRYELLATSRLISIGLRVGLVLVLLSRGEPLLAMALIFAATECLVGILNQVFAWRLMPRRPFQLASVHWTLLKGMFAYGVNTFVYSVGALAVAKTGEIIVGTYLPPEHITYYTLALMPPMMISGLVESFSASIKPAVSDLDSHNDLPRIRQITLLSQKYVLFFILPAMAFFLILGNNFYSIWLHREMKQAVLLLYILSAGHLVRAAQVPVFLVLAGRGEHRAFGIMTVAMGLGAVILGVIFCRVLGWGSYGVALGSTASMVIVCGIVLPYHGAKQLGLKLGDCARLCLWPAVLGVTPCILLLGLWKVWQPPGNLWELSLVGLSTGLVLACSIWLLGLSKEERSRFGTTALASLQKVAPIFITTRIARLR